MIPVNRLVKLLKLEWFLMVLKLWFPKNSVIRPRLNRKFQNFRNGRLKFKPRLPLLFRLIRLVILFLRVKMKLKMPRRVVGVMNTRLKPLLNFIGKLVRARGPQIPSVLLKKPFKVVPLCPRGLGLFQSECRLFLRLTVIFRWVIKKPLFFIRLTLLCRLSWVSLLSPLKKVPSAVMTTRGLFLLLRRFLLTRIAMILLMLISRLLIIAFIFFVLGERWVVMVKTFAVRLGRISLIRRRRINLLILTIFLMSQKSRRLTLKILRKSQSRFIGRRFRVLETRVPSVVKFMILKRGRFFLIVTGRL